MDLNKTALNSPYPGRAAFRVLLGGMLGLAVVMGIGRFAFTPILPLMQRDLGMSHAVAGGLAGLNYLGYLAGAIVCTVAPRLLLVRILAPATLLLSLGTTFLMGMTQAELGWELSRFWGGVASAILFVLISAEVGERLTRLGYGHWFGALYGGVGTGIALSGLLVPQLDRVWGWDGAWIGMGVVAVILACVGALLGHKSSHVPTLSPATAAAASASPSLRGVWLLGVAYFFEGLGYIVSATFMVAIVAQIPRLAGIAAYSWVAVGLAAIPSTMFWPWLAHRVGYKKALVLAYVLQAAGILVSSGADSLGTVLFAAVTFGGTFMGIVALTLTEGKRRLEHAAGRAAAFLTACFGVGQVVGPVVAGTLADMYAGFTLPLLFAGGSVVLGAVLIMADRRF
ncbi:MAG: YbfB/YjiJ family MFS transporter [Desulfuromonas sp.]